VEILRSARYFAELPDDALARLAAGCVRRTYGRGQYLWYQGDDGAHLAVIGDGLVKVVISSEHGDEVVLRTLGPGATLGELALLDGSPRSAAVVAVEPTTALLLTRATVLELLGRHPSVLDALLRSLDGLVRGLTEQAGDLAEAHGSGAQPPTVDIRLSQSDLAAMVGATRPAVNRVLQGMAARGLIAVSGQAIALLDLDALRRRAGG
jgi:CRP-like cAMP-binding protein